MTENVEVFLEDKFDMLMGEYDAHRLAIKEMIGDLEKFKKRIDTLLPENVDARYMRYFEEKIKAVTSLFNSLLDMRKEITKSVKDEIEIRRKSEGTNDNIDLEGLIDVRSMVDTIDKFKQKTENIKHKRIEENKNNIDNNLVPDIFKSKNDMHEVKNDK